MKSVRKILSVILIVTILVNLVPAFNLNNGRGVEAATSKEIVNDANSWVNKTPYVWGGTDLINGCDCSGFVCAIYKRHGLDLINKYGIRRSQEMYSMASKYGVIVGNTPSKMRDGYIIIFDSSLGEAGHAGICASDANGNKEVIHACNTARGTKRDAISWLCGGSNGMKIRAIIKPNALDGKLVNNVTSGQATVDTGKTDNTTTTQTTTEVNTDQNSERNNPGYPYPLQKKKVVKSNYTGMKWVQAALNKVNNAGLVVDGIYGPLTKGAIKNFQKKYGMAATGKANKSTVKKLTKVYKINQGVVSLQILAGDGPNGEFGKIIKVGQKLQLGLNVIPASSQSVKVKWKSTNRKVAKINSKGVITARKPGRARIIVTAPNGVRQEINIEVQAAE